jgi:Putative zinc binding domain
VIPMPVVEMDVAREMDVASDNVPSNVASIGRSIRCRHCGTPLQHTLINLGMSPLCESFLTESELDAPETYYPLHVRVCHVCWLVQLPEFVSPAHIFTEYAYFSSYSTTWVAHAQRYCEMIKSRLQLAPKSSVVELGSNDGYLLQHFVALGLQVLGVEPAANVAESAPDSSLEPEGRDRAADAPRQRMGWQVHRSHPCGVNYRPYPCFPLSVDFSCDYAGICAVIDRLDACNFVLA